MIYINGLKIFGFGVLVGILIGTIFMGFAWYMNGENK